MRSRAARATICRVKKLRAILLACVAIGAAAPGSTFAASATSTDRVIVKWREAGTAARIADDKVAALAERRGRRLAAGRVIGGGMSVVNFDRERAGRPRRRHCRPSQRSGRGIRGGRSPREALTYAPNDPLFTTGQWYLKAAQPSAIRADPPRM